MAEIYVISAQSADLQGQGKQVFVSVVGAYIKLWVIPAYGFGRTGKRPGFGALYVHFQQCDGCVQDIVQPHGLYRQPVLGGVRAA